MSVAPSRTSRLVAAVLGATAAGRSPEEIYRAAEGRVDVLELALAVADIGPAGEAAIVAALRLAR